MWRQDLANRNIGYLQKVREFWCLWATAALLYCNALFSTKFVISVQLHPDLNPGDPRSHAKFVRLNEAHSVLSNLQSRREYDLQFTWSTRAPQRSRHMDPHYSRQSASPYASYHRCGKSMIFFSILFHSYTHINFSGFMLSAGHHKKHLVSSKSHSFLA